MMNTDLTSAASVLADVKTDKNKNGGKLLLYGVNQDYSGDITCDESSKVKLVLTEGSSYSGTQVNPRAETDHAVAFAAGEGVALFHAADDPPGDEPRHLHHNP